MIPGTIRILQSQLATSRNIQVIDIMCYSRIPIKIDLISIYRDITRNAESTSYVLSSVGCQMPQIHRRASQLQRTALRIDGIGINICPIALQSQRSTGGSTNVPVD